LDLDLDLDLEGFNVDARGGFGVGLEVGNGISKVEPKSLSMNLCTKGRSSLSLVKMRRRGFGWYPYLKMIHRGLLGLRTFEDLAMCFLRRMFHHEYERAVDTLAWFPLSGLMIFFCRWRRGGCFQPRVQGQSV